MTVVIAERIGETILMLSDTMITDEQGIRLNALPGRLKSVIPNRPLSVDDPPMTGIGSVVPLGWRCRASGPTRKDDADLKQFVCHPTDVGNGECGIHRGRAGSGFEYIQRKPVLF